MHFPNVPEIELGIYSKKVAKHVRAIAPGEYFIVNRVDDFGEFTRDISQIRLKRKFLPSKLVAMLFHQRTGRENGTINIETYGKYTKEDHKLEAAIGNLRLMYGQTDS